MSIQDLNNLTSEVRIRHGSQFQQMPNFIVAGQQIQNGTFVYLHNDDAGEVEYWHATRLTPATHLVIKSGVPRLTHDDIVNFSEVVNIGEPAMTVTGYGTATIPFAATATAGQELTLNDNGFAIPRTPGQASYLVGTALQDVVVPSGEAVLSDALINLPAKYSA
jgi:hypothetical protein